MGFTQEDNVVTFKCDNCPETLTCTGTFVECSAAAHRHNWIALKRTGFVWSFHCSKCADQARREHDEYRRNEEQRERTKAFNEGRK